MTHVDRAVRDLRLVATYWPGLREMRIPGTPLPWRPIDISPEARAERDYQARLERQERTDLMPGEHPDAVSAHVLDVLSELVIEADHLAGLVAQRANAPYLTPPSTAFADPRPYLHHAATHLPAADANQPDSQFAHWAADRAAHMLTTVSRQLCLMHDGQRLNIVCPWCRGGLAGTPSWRVRELPGDQIAIVCESGLCEPPSKHVGTWWRGAPCWPMREWDWLAGIVQAADDRNAVA